MATDTGWWATAAASAALVHAADVAVHQLLLRQRHQPPRPDLVQPFHRRHRRERPAAAAQSLVLDAGDGAHGPPVHALRRVRQAEVLVPEPAGRRRSRAPEPGPGRAELLDGEVGEPVGRQPVAVRPCGVERVDQLRVGPEHLQPPRLLGLILVRAPVLRHPLLVPRRHRGGGRRERAGSGGGAQYGAAHDEDGEEEP